MLSILSIASMNDTRLGLSWIEFDSNCSEQTPTLKEHTFRRHHFHIFVWMHRCTHFSSWSQYVFVRQTRILVMVRCTVVSTFIRHNVEKGGIVSDRGVVINLNAIMITIEDSGPKPTKLEQIFSFQATVWKRKRMWQCCWVCCFCRMHNYHRNMVRRHFCPKYKRTCNNNKNIRRATPFSAEVSNFR